MPNEQTDENYAIRLEGLDNCIVGVDTNGYYIYDYGQLLYHFIEVEKMKESEAVEWIDYNILGLMSETKKFIVMFDEWDE